MIRKLSLAFISVFLILALALKLAGFDSVNDLLSGTGHDNLGSFSYSFLQQLNLNLSRNPIQIPLIPKINALNNVSGSGFLDFISTIANAIIVFFNGITSIANLLITLFNLIIDVFVFIFTFFKVVFDYWKLNILTFSE